jgi:hypothetical protein
MADHTHLAPLLAGEAPNNQIAYKHQLLNDTVAALGTVQLGIPGQSVKRVIEFTTVSTVETIAITGSIDGTNFEAAFKPIVASTGLLASSTNLASGTYIIPANLPYQQIKFTKSAGVNQGIVSIVEVNYPAS